MSTQIKIGFQAKSLAGIYPFKYHLLRVGNGDLVNRFWHVNTLFEGYNCRNYPTAEIDTRTAKYSLANTTADIKKILIEAAEETKPYKTHYIMATMHSSEYKSMMAYKE